jgi:alkyl sulfatase BDS1-like metallo-beta-lactamase superfamily hydrolase
MSVYGNTEKFEKVMSELYSTCFEDEKTGPKFKKMNIVLKYIVTDLNANLYVDTGKFKVVEGEYDRKPNIELTVMGDVLHDFMLKKFTIAKALGDKKVKVKGPIFKIMKMIPLLSKGFEVYPEIVKKNGIGKA